MRNRAKRANESLRSGGGLCPATSLAGSIDVMRKLIVNDGTFDRELQLVERLVIGRDPECDLSDTNTLLSRRHAEFIANGNDVAVRDLGSRNGVFINGARVAEAQVRPGDVVRIGHFSIKYVEAADLHDPRRAEQT